MLVADLDNDQVQTVFSSESEHPFYLYWSPDNSNVSFLSTSGSGQSMILQNVPAVGGDPTIIDSGSPYYWSWAPDGKTMIVHTGGVNSTSPEHLAFLRVDTEVLEFGLDSPSAAFQAPAWSPDGSQILLARAADEKNEIILTDSSGAFEKAIGTFQTNTSFAWSHNSELVAYIAGEQSMTAGSIGSMHVMDIRTSEDFFQDRDVIAFFWSPNSERLAYFKPLLADAGQGGSDPSAQQRLLLQLNMLDVSTGESRVLFTYQPTEQFVAMLPYFDQYHQSVTIWSPDSNNLVLSFLNSEGSPGIAIVADSGQMDPRILAEGYLAFWSWQ
jgi:TolB protein